MHSSAGHEEILHPQAVVLIAEESHQEQTTICLSTLNCYTSTEHSQAQVTSNLILQKQPSKDFYPTLHKQKRKRQSKGTDGIFT